MTKKDKEIMKKIKTYEKTNPLTEDERQALYEWVKDGNDIFDNGSYACDEYGRPLEFIEDYRNWEWIREETKNMNERECENFIGRLVNRDTIDNLREDLNSALLKIESYEFILRKYGLLKEADEYIKLWSEEKYRRIEDENLPF